MPSTELDRTAAFLASFARRQAAEVTDFPGGFAVRDETYARSWEHNQVVVEGETEPELLVERADVLLEGLRHRMVTVLSEPVAQACAPLLEAAGYRHGTVLVMIHRGPRPTPGFESGTVRSAETVDLDTLRPSLTLAERAFWPNADEQELAHLTERRTGRLKGAPEVRFLAARADDGSVAAWADLYADPAAGIAQLEDLVTLESQRGRGHGDTVLATALALATGVASDGGLFFLLADADDWPKEWYARRGFVPSGSFHVFTRPGQDV